MVTIIIKLRSKVFNMTISIMNKEFFKLVARFILKYVVPVVCGYLEGDSHYIQDCLF